MINVIRTPQDLQLRLEQKNPDDILLDVRTPEEFAAGNIPGSTNFDISGLDLFDKIERLDPTKTYILYCRSGSRSQMAAMIMSQKGLNVINCEFGFIDL